MDLRKLMQMLMDLGMEPEDLANFAEGCADAIRKGLTPEQAAIYALLETQSEELSEDDGITSLLNEAGYAESAEDRQQVLREIFRAVAKKF